MKKGNAEIQNAADRHYSGTFGYPAPFAKLQQWNKIVGDEKGKCQDVQLHIGWKLKTNNPKHSEKKILVREIIVMTKRMMTTTRSKENPYTFHYFSYILIQSSSTNQIRLPKYRGNNSISGSVPLGIIMTTDIMDANEKKTIHYFQNLWPLAFYITFLYASDFTTCVELLWH